MKVKELIKFLKRFSPDMDVEVLHNGCENIEYISLTDFYDVYHDSLGSTLMIYSEDYARLKKIEED